MSDLDTEIRRVFGELVAATPAAPPFPTTMAPRVSRRPRIALAGALSLAIVAIVVVSLLAVRPDRRRFSATPTPTAASRLTVRTSLLASRLPVPVYRTMAASDGRTIYLLGGLTQPGKNLNTIYAFDPTSGRFNLAGRLAAPTHGGNALWVDGRAIVYGGAETMPRDWVQSFDPSTRRTVIAAHLPAKRADDGVARVGTRTLVFGGFDGINRLGDVFASDGGAFRMFAQLKEPIRYPAVATSGRSAYLFGGLLTGAQYTGTFSANIQSVDAISGVTKIVGRLPTPRTHVMAAVVRGRIFVIGGTTPKGPTTDVLEFDPREGTLARVASLPHAISDGGIAVVGDTAYIFGGFTTASQQTVMSVSLGP